MNETPNTKQAKLINNTEGIYLVDAGAGTGKTFTVTKRYAELLKKEGIEPNDILLITFTNNAANEMKEEVMNQTNDNSSKLRDAPISTFHSLCKNLLDAHGFSSPKELGINDNITSTTRIIENQVQEKKEFRNYYYNFIDNNPEYNDFYKIIKDPGELLDLIKSLGAKGIFPTKNNWYRNGEKYLNGNFKKFKEKFNEINKPRNDGSKQSILRKKLGNYNRNKIYLCDAPRKDQIRGKKKIKDEFAKKAFQEDRTRLKKFIHDIYYQYIQYVLGRNYLNFQFLMMFAYVLLCEDHSLRENLDYEYVMVDEFQDTNEIQFKLSMLLSKKDNLAVVGDWKQSIYKFKYASVENIIKFKSRLKKYKKELNQNHKRINYQVKEINKIDLTNNYRSTQRILDFSENSLGLEATSYEDLDKQEIKDKITSLESDREENSKVKTRIEALKSEEEIESILTKIHEVVDNPDYKIEDEDELRCPEYGDIAILTRTRKFGLKLQDKAEKLKIPVAYESGVELFKTNPSKLLLAWLRILENKNSKRGWSVILEKNGYKIDIIDHILQNKDYPDNILEFRSRLKGNVISKIARKVFERYGMDNNFTDKIIEVLQTVFNNSNISVGEIIQFIEKNIRAEEIYDVDSGYEEDVVKIQTIHAAKGLEYPIVFIVDINSHKFPNTNTDSKNIQYKDTIGIRQKKIYSEKPNPYPYDNWHSQILFKCFQNYDEERRLMYVAMTRAQDHLLLTSKQDRSSRFFEEIENLIEETEEPNIQLYELEPELKELPQTEKSKEKVFRIEEPKEKAPIKLSVHGIMETEKIETEETEQAEGTEYGTKVHEFAEKYVQNKDLEPSNKDEQNVKALIDRLDGELITEEPCILPLQTKNRKVTLRGIIDLLHLTNKEIQIIDYKTDRTKKYQKEYKKQLSVYYKIIEQVFNNKNVSAHIYYTNNKELTKIKPLKQKEIKKIIEGSQ